MLPNPGDSYTAKIAGNNGLIPFHWDVLTLLQTSPKTPRGVMYYNSFISVSMLQGQHPISATEPFAPHTDQPPARSGRLVCFTCPQASISS